MKTAHAFLSGFLLLFSTLLIAQEKSSGEQAPCNCSCTEVEYYEKFNSPTFGRHALTTDKMILISSVTKPAGNKHFVFQQDQYDTLRYRSRPEEINVKVRVYREGLSLPVTPLTASQRQCEISKAGDKSDAYGDILRGSEESSTLPIDDIEFGPGWEFSTSVKTEKVETGNVRVFIIGILNMKDLRKDADACTHGLIKFYHISYHLWGDTTETSSLLPSEDVSLALISTGNTIGDIARAHLRNDGPTTQTIDIGPLIIRGDSAHQFYHADGLPTITLEPGQDTIIGLPGICLDPFTPPVTAGDTISLERIIPVAGAPPFTAATPRYNRPDFEYFDSDPTDSIFVTVPGTDIPLNGTVNFELFPELSAGLVHDIVTGISTTVDTLIATGQMPPNPYSRNPEVLRDASKQQATWVAISRLTDPDSAYTKEDFTSVLERQYEEQTGVDITDAPVAVQEELSAGSDQLWSLFTFVGEKAKVLNTPAEAPPAITDEVIEEMIRRLNGLDLSESEDAAELDRIIGQLSNFADNAEVSSAALQRLADLIREKIIEKNKKAIQQLNPEDASFPSDWWKIFQEKRAMSQANLLPFDENTVTLSPDELTPIRDSLFRLIRKYYGDQVDGLDPADPDFPEKWRSLRDEVSLSEHIGLPTGADTYEGILNNDLRSRLLEKLDSLLGAFKKSEIEELDPSAKDFPAAADRIIAQLQDHASSLREAGALDELKEDLQAKADAWKEAQGEDISSEAESTYRDQSMRIHDLGTGISTGMPLTPELSAREGFCCTAGGQVVATTREECVSCILNGAFFATRAEAEKECEKKQSYSSPFHIREWEDDLVLDNGLTISGILDGPLERITKIFIKVTWYPHSGSAADSETRLYPVRIDPATGQIDASGIDLGKEGRYHLSLMVVETTYEGFENISIDDFYNCNWPPEWEELGSISVWTPWSCTFDVVERGGQHIRENYRFNRDYQRIGVEGFDPFGRLLVDYASETYRLISDNPQSSIYTWNDAIRVLMTDPKTGRFRLSFNRDEWWKQPREEE